MSHSKLAVGLVLVLVCGSARSALAQQEPQPAGPAKDEAKLPLCPVLGEPVDFTVKTMTADGPVYFCCKDCIPKFEKDPAKYAEKVTAQREALKKLERIQVACPVSGNPIDGKTFAMVDGQRVYFCCKDCIPAYEKDPSKYRAKLEASYTYQTKCPVSGEKIDPTAFIDLPTGQRVYMCCPKCGDKLVKDIETYAPKLAAQGVNVDLKKFKEGESKPGGHEHEHP